MQYLPTWSETGIDISTLNYFHVQNMQCLHLFIHMVWKWYRYVGTKLFPYGIHGIFIHIVWKLVSKRWNQMFFLFVKCSIIINILFIVSMSKPNDLFQPWQIITVFFMCIYNMKYYFIHMLCKKHRHVETESFSFALKSSVFSYNQHVCNSIPVIMLLFSYFIWVYKHSQGDSIRFPASKYFHCK